MATSEAPAGAAPEPAPGAEAPSTLGLATTHALGWLVLAIVDAILIEARVPWADRVVDRVVLHAVDAAHFVGLALTSSFVLRMVEPLVRRRRWVGWVSLAILAAAVGFFVLPDDLDTFFARKRIGPITGTVISTAGAAVAIPMVHALGRLAARPWVRWAAVSLALALGIANGLVLDFDYPGGHLLAAWSAVLLAGAALSNVPRASSPAPSAWPRRPVTHAVALILVLASWFVPTSDVVWRDVQVLPSAVVPPFFSRVLAALPFTDGGVSGMGEWWTDRDDAPPTPPSGEVTLPADAAVILLTIDALRADMLSDETAETLPELHALARESVAFSNARSPSPSTGTTFSTLFTGRYYSQLHWTAASKRDATNGVFSIDEDTSPRLNQLLDERGVGTVVVAALHGFLNEGGATAGFTESLKTKRDYGPAEEAMALLLSHLERHERGRRFYFMHLVDAHAPYDRGGTDGSSKERYLRELQIVDAQVGRLRRELQARRLGDRTVLIVSADHGEAFGEHGTEYHAATVYDELLRVPLLIRAPGVRPSVVDTPVGVVDIGPTVLDLFGVDTPGTHMGTSLVPALVGKPLGSKRPIAAESGRRMQAVVFPDGVKAIVDRRRRTAEVFDLTKDPAELHNLADDPRYRAAGYTQMVRSFFDAHAFSKPGYRIPVRRF